MEIKVSVTVAVYNTSKYLSKCLDSLKAQPLKEIEFILVDDGSTDDSGKICDEYAKRDPRFKVIHKENGGLATARQTGLENSVGEYVIVCDSDDWVEPDMYEKLYEFAKKNNSDIAVCGGFLEYSSGKSVPFQHIFLEKNNSIDKSDFLNNGAASNWLKLIKRDLFLQTQASYEKGIDLGEDSLIIYKLMKGTPRIHQLKGNYYHYRRLFGENTYTNNLKPKHIKQLQDIYFWLINNYPEEEYFPLIQQRAIDIAVACLRTEGFNDDALKEFLKRELPWKNLFKAKKNVKTLFVGMEKVLPIGVSRFLFRKLYPFFYS